MRAMHVAVVRRTVELQETAVPRKPPGPALDPHETHPLDKFPYVEIHDWEFHQPTTGPDWHRVSNTAFLNRKYRALSAAERGLVHGLWMLRGDTGRNPPRDPEWVASALGLGHNRYVSGHMKTLERKGFLVPRVHQKRREERRGEQKRENKAADAVGGGVDSKEKTYPDWFEVIWAPVSFKVEKRKALKACKAKRAELPPAEELATKYNRYVAGRRSKDRDATPQALCRWVDGSRWEDETGSDGNGKKRELTKIDILWAEKRRLLRRQQDGWIEPAEQEKLDKLLANKEIPF